MIDQDKIAFILAKQCYEQTQGEWEPSMGQSHDMVDAILQELSDDTPAEAQIDEIDWRQMFLEVHDRMRKAGESKEMGARWFSESARAALKEAK
jgi:hypothetical protein